MSADVGFILGYGGFCTIRSGIVGDSYDSEIKVPLLSGNYDRSMNVPMQSTFSIPLNEKKRGKIRTGIGTYSYSGSINFELSEELRDLIFDSSGKFFRRDGMLKIELCDGEGKIKIPGCVWNSIGIQADTGGFIQSNMSFQSCNGYEHDIDVSNATNSTADYSNLPELEPYWKYGEEGVQSFQLNFSRAVTPVYLNEKRWIGPSYLRVGMMDATLGITCWEKWFDHTSIKLGNKTLKFDKGSFQNSRGYQFAGLNSEGMKNYTLTAASLEGDGDLFTIS